MKNKRNVFYSLLILLAGLIYFPVQAQQTNEVQAKNTNTSYGPKGIVRTVKQDRKGNIWIASWQGIFKYDGKSFTNMTRKVSSARFFSVLENRKGNFWFASIGSGVYYYNGKTFRNFTTREGLANDRVTNIYEDKTGNIWFGTESGVSRYDGKSFRNIKMNEGASINQSDSVHISIDDHAIPETNWMHNDVNAIIEDKRGKFWFGTRGYARVYDGNTFTTITNKEGKPFANVRSIIEDKKGNVWLGGKDGLWRYDGNSFTNFTQDFVGYIYEDSAGNIWTSSENAHDKKWRISRYDRKSLSDKSPSVTEIKSGGNGFFGIVEARDKSIWFGSMNGVYRYDLSCGHNY